MHLYMVSASTSPNQTRRFGVKFCPVSSNMATSPPPFNCTQTTFPSNQSFPQETNEVGELSRKKSALFVPVSSRPQARGWQASGQGPCPRRKCILPCLCWWLSRRRHRWSSPCLVPLGMEWPSSDKMRRDLMGRQTLTSNHKVCNHERLKNGRTQSSTPNESWG